MVSVNDKFNLIRIKFPIQIEPLSISPAADGYIT